MKHKYIFRTMTALCAALLIVGGLSVPAYAQTPEGQDATNDDNVIVEQPKEDTPPLTPEGNAALVDDYGGNKQLITVTTEADLMALMETGQTTEEKPTTCNCTKKCEAGAVNTACPVCATNLSGCTGKAPEPEVTEEPEKEPAGLNPALLILVLALLGGGGAFAYFKLVKNKPKTKGNDNLDDYDYGEDEADPEDEEPWEIEGSDEPDADRGSDGENEDKQI